ncbi:MAG: hypothetical protein LC624_02045 [Halobacteriales archaeon]|nr:hypothetical protein [Halobacteriales archaeon]
MPGLTLLLLAFGALLVAAAPAHAVGIDVCLTRPGDVAPLCASAHPLRPIVGESPFYVPLPGGHALGISPCI